MKINNMIRKMINIKFFRGGNLITYIEAKELLKENTNTVLLDVRSNQEYNEYHLDGAINIPLYELRMNVNNIILNKNNIIIVYCQTGGRSKKAVNILKKLGYTNIYEINGGIDNI